METIDRNVASTAKQAALKALGIRLRIARTNAGLSQKAVAGHIDVSTQTVRNWEVGRHEPSGQAINTLAALYRVPMQQLQQHTAGADALGGPNGLYQDVDVEPLRLKTARRASGLTQAQVASRAGLTISSVRRYERGTAVPSDKTLNRLALIYRKPARWFISNRAGCGSGDTFRQLALPMDEATSAYALVHPELSEDSVRTIADFIMFVYQQQVDRSKEQDTCAQIR